MKKEETEGQEIVVTEMAADESWNGNTEKDQTREGKRGSKQKRTNAQELKFSLKKSFEREYMCMGGKYSSQETEISQYQVN